MTPPTNQRPAYQTALAIEHRHALEEIAAYVRGGQSVALTGAARSLTTALLLHLSDPRSWPELGLDDTNLFVYLDGATLHDRGYEAIFGQFALEMTAALAERRFAPEPALDAAVAQPTRLVWETAMRKINQRGLRVVLILDSFEALAGNPRLGVGFFNVLRSITARYQLVLLTASSLRLFELTYAGCAEEIVSSPFFNIFASVYLAPSTYMRY